MMKVVRFVTQYGSQQATVFSSEPPNNESGYINLWVVWLGCVVVVVVVSSNMSSLSCAPSRGEVDAMG